jgi:hypothetical protein
VEHEQSTRSPAVVGDDGSLDAELVGRAGLALADALDLRGMERIKLPAALALLLRADLGGSAQREGERLLQCRVVLDPAADVADDAAEPAAQEYSSGVGRLVELQVSGEDLALRLALRSVDASRGPGRG